MMCVIAITLAGRVITSPHLIAKLVLLARMAIRKWPQPSVFWERGPRPFADHGDRLAKYDLYSG
jgi:hypothetical protein